MLNVFFMYYIILYYIYVYIYIYSHSMEIDNSSIERVEEFKYL